ncbi:3-coathanger stack domain-containing protein [Runella sp.]|uniref:3-coathanger stack domain-containing protein n=1 Tax=Runella sp. TaxID=1960881 RepID=UPI003D116622
MQKFSTYCLFFFFALTAIAQEKTSIDVQLNLQNQTGSPYFCEGSKMTLIATPNEPGLSYQWFLDGKLSETTTANTLPVRSAGNYSVTVSNAQISGTSSKLTINACPDNSAEIAAIWAQSLKDGKGKPPKEIQSAFTATISSANPVLCNGNTSAALVAQPQGAQYTYQWQYASCSSCTYTNQAGQTNNSLTTSTTGFYRVVVTENGTAITANPFQVASVPYATLTDQSDNPNGVVTVTPGQSASLKVNFTGTGPFYFSYSDGSGTKSVSNITSNPYILVVTPDQNRRYKLTSAGNNSCGISTGEFIGNVRVVVDPSTSVTLPTPTNLNVCAGSTIEIPYTTLGMWTAARNLAVQLINETDGSGLGTQSGQSDSPLRVSIPSYLPPFSQYRIGVLPVLPAGVAGPVISSYILTVTNVGCLPKPIVYMSPANQACNSVYLFTNIPGSNSNSNYQWFRNGIAIPNTTSSGFYAYESGNYYVKVTNATTNYSDSSAIQTVTLLSSQITITSPNPVLCGNNTTAVLTATTTNTGGTWQWYNYDVPISGATNATYTASGTGYYQAVYTNAGCTSTGSFNVTNYANATLTTLSGNSSQSIPLGAGTQLKATFTGQGPWTFQMYDGSGYKRMTTTESPYLIAIRPEQNRSYYLTSILSSGCTNTGYSNNSVNIIVDPNTTFTLPTPGTLNVCAGSTIDIPYITTGTWTNDRKLYVELRDANNNYISNTGLGSFSENPIRYTLPASLGLNSLIKVRVSSELPYYNSLTSSYQLTVSNIGCQPAATIRNSSSIVQCGNAYLYAYPQGNGYTYQWFLNGNSIVGATESFYSAFQSGAYTVQVSNTSNGYNSTSTATAVTISMPGVSITPSNGALCNGGQVTLNATPSDGATYDYQWYYRAIGENDYSLISGYNSADYNAVFAGYYYVIVTPKTGNCSVTSSTVSVSNSGMATLTNANGNNSNVFISVGQTVPLTVTMTGQPPFVFQYSDGTYIRRITTDNSTYTLNVTPEQNRTYSLYGFENSCSSGNVNGSVNVIVDVGTSIVLPTPANLNACAGGTVEIPYTLTGTWTGNKYLYVTLVNPANGGFITSYSISSLGNSITLPIPASLSIGSSFQIRVNASVPYFTTVVSNYIFTVTSAGCIASPQIQESFPRQCGTASFSTQGISGYSYQWYRDGVFSSSGSSGYTATISGNYTVRVTGPNGYDVTSAPYTVNAGSISRPFISRTGGTDCSDGSNFTLFSSLTDPAFTYQWYYAPVSNGPFLPVTGANSSSLTTNKPGGYFVTVQSGDCQAESNKYYTCPLLVDFKSTSICQNSSVTVKYSSNFCCYSDIKLSLHLVDATSGNSVVSNIASLTGYSSYTFANVIIPSSVPTGTYRFVITSGNPTYISPKSIGILTITNNLAPTPPVITASPSSVSPGQGTTLTASNCNGTIRWIDNGILPAIRSVTPNGTAAYSAICLDVNGCISSEGSVTVTTECDPLEPNNTYLSATHTNNGSYLSPEVCLDSKNDVDWYTYVYNNKVFYINVVSVSNVYSYYKLSINVVNDSLRIETLPSSGSYLFTYVRLYADNGTTLLGSDYDSGVNYFSLLKYKLPSPCPSVLSLYSTILDIAPGQTNTAKALQINATNKIGDGATANYYGQNSVLLSPGFQTNLSTGGSFNAIIQGCN